MKQTCNGSRSAGNAPAAPGVCQICKGKPLLQAHFDLLNFFIAGFQREATVLERHGFLKQYAFAAAQRKRVYNENLPLRKAGEQFLSGNMCAVDGAGNSAGDADV